MLSAKDEPDFEPLLSMLRTGANAEGSAAAAAVDRKTIRLLARGMHRVLAMLRIVRPSGWTE